jgi:RND family efflux transporter MFP subunit
LSTLVLGLVPALGIAVLMMVLAGYFSSKVEDRPVSTAVNHRQQDKSQGEAIVKLVRRPRLESAVGTIRPIHEAIVASKILARVEQVHVKAGQQVKAGEILIELDKAELKSRLEQAEAAEMAAKAKFDQAEIELGRAQRLRTRESITQSEFDQANTALRTAKAELDRSRRAVEEARIFEGYATIRAPISGRVVDKKVNAGDTVTPGQAILSMYDPAAMQLIATVRESLALRLKVGQVIPTRLDAFDYECQATISEIVPEAQAESRSFQVKVVGPCPPNIYSGMFGRIFIPLAHEDVLVVPQEAIRRVGQLDEVDVLADNRVTRRVVQLGRTLNEGREILSGLSVGERVARPQAAHRETEKDRP